MALEDDDLNEYVELLNITGGSVPLFDPLVPTNTWALRDAVEFVFPPGVILQAGEMVLVVGTDDVAGFRETNNIPTNVTVYSAWGGKLDNSSESVRLYKPDPPNTNAVPYILVDRVDYRDDLPWPPGPDGQGSSLERITATSFGNEPQSWQSSEIGGSPGEGNHVVESTDIIIISEFMAENEGTLSDEDGDVSDWVELFNTSTTDVNLVNWYLTDTATNLTQWMFPSVVIPAGGHLVVFASGKDRAESGSELHTNFRLDPEGEYLGLIRPNLYIEYDFAPEYPPQSADVSYGHENTGGVVVQHIVEGQSGRVLVPVVSNDVEAAWNTIGYDDSTWASVPTGIGYDLQTDYDPFIATDLQSQMYIKARDRIPEVFIHAGFRGVGPGVDDATVCATTTGSLPS